jgi:type IV pilus assembly protein PilE
MQHIRSRGFTLIELLVVIAIIGILSSVVLASLNTARNKGADAATKSQLASMRAAAEIFYDNGTTYNGLCASASFSNMRTAAASSSGATTNLLSSANPPSQVGTLTQVTCHDTAAAPVSAWVVDAPIKAGGMWCVDSTGASKAEGTYMLAAATACI